MSDWLAEAKARCEAAAEADPEGYEWDAADLPRAIAALEAADRLVAVVAMHAPPIYECRYPWEVDVNEALAAYREARK